MKTRRIAMLPTLILALLMCCACTQNASSSAVSASSGSAAPSSASASSASSAAATEALHVMALDGPAGVGFAKLSQDGAYDMRFADTVDDVVGAVKAGSADIAAVPVNLAAALYNETQGGVQLIAVDAYGELYLMQNGEGISSLQDLAGNHVYAAGTGTITQYVFEYLLWQVGVEPGMAVDVEYLSDLSELTDLVANGKADLALLPEPNASDAQSRGAENLRRAIDVSGQWRDTTGTQLVVGCIVVRGDYAKAHPEAVRQFLDDFAASAAFAGDDVEGAAKLCVEAGIMPDAESAKAAISHCPSVCVTGDEARGIVDAFLNVLFRFNPDSVGGAVPDGAFYFAE